jgi:hypothetical protein
MSPEDSNPANRGVNDVAFGDPRSDLVTRSSARVLGTITVVGLRPGKSLHTKAADGVTELDLAGHGAGARRLGEDKGGAATRTYG